MVAIFKLQIRALPEICDRFPAVTINWMESRTSVLFDYSLLIERIRNMNLLSERQRHESFIRSMQQKMIQL